MGTHIHIHTRSRSHTHTNTHTNAHHCHGNTSPSLLHLCNNKTHRLSHTQENTKWNYGNAHQVKLREPAFFRHGRLLYRFRGKRTRCAPMHAYTHSSKGLPLDPGTFPSALEQFCSSFCSGARKKDWSSGAFFCPH